MSSHWNTKLLASVFDRGSASMRWTCLSSVAGSLSLFLLARSSSSSSGIEFHRKNESFDASSRSVIAYFSPGFNPAGTRSPRYRKNGLASIPVTPARMPDSKPPCFTPSA